MTLNVRFWIFPILILIAVGNGWSLAKLRQIKPGCRYEGRRYQEGTVVTTSEPCLQCRCNEGALRCRLRVCPRLPNSLPPGCHIRAPPENVCCAELVCGQPRDSENMLRRSNVQLEEKIEEEKESRVSRLEGCLHEGVRYAPGSAMMGSRRCEYCYCISGARRCIRPKCLLPLPGCTPLYAPQSCCPVAYNCTHVHSSTAAPVPKNGCRVAGRTYDEGEMVRDIAWKDACDNCFCAMSAIRCVPLACAPPLQGCSPIVRQGQCCPSTYNCSGSIEVKAVQNYASYAFISKDYAKFRKETNFFPAIEHTTNVPVEGRGHRVVEEQIDTSTIDSDIETSSMSTDSTSWASTLETEIMDNEILIETMDYTKLTPEVTTGTTVLSTEEYSTKMASTIMETTEHFATLTLCCSTTLQRNISTTTGDLSSTIEVTTSKLEVTTMEEELIVENITENVKNSNFDEDDLKGSSTRFNATNIIPIFTNETTVQILPKEKIDEEGGSPENDPVTEAIIKGSVTSPSSTVLMPDDILVMNVTVKTNVSVGNIQGVTINPITSISPDVEAILNITHREKAEEYGYDDSLPNLRIIPFVAADALVKDKDVPSTATGYSPVSVVVPPDLRPTDNSGFYDIATQENRFSPPVETEGGFVPREPYFDTSYHSTDLNLEIGTGVTVVPALMTNPHRKTDGGGNCIFVNREYRHGEVVPSTEICTICTCFYGEVVCSSEKCPPLKIGCQRMNTEEGCCGKIVCVDTDESPTVVLDRAGATAPSQRQPIVSPDTFRYVIKTKPAPDLQSLIEDMIPHLVEHGIAIPRSTTPRPTLTTPTASLQSQNHQKHPTNFDYDSMSLMHPPFDYREDNLDSLMPVSEEKYNVELSPKEPILLLYPSKSPEGLRDHDSKIKDAGSFNYDKITITKTDYSMESFKDNQFPSDAGFHNKVQQRNITKDNEEIVPEFIADDQKSEKSPVNNQPTLTDNSSEEDSLFSLDSVLDLFFSSETTSKSPKTTESTRTADTVTTSIDTSTSTVKSISQEETTTETPSKFLDNEIPASMAGLLKLAGCNIYGRMYRVGRIITELSGPCLECRCTEIGVQCKQLEC